MPEEEQKFQKRQVAYKVTIGDILNSKYIKTDGVSPNYLEINSREISRVNIMGVVVEKSKADNYKIVIVDDGTGKISARVFENNLSLEGIDANDVVLIIGRPREFSSEKYVLIETIKKIDYLWAKVRKIELEKGISADVPAHERTISQDNRLIEEEIIGSDSSPANKVIKLIKDLDKGNGVAIEEISSKNIDEIDKIIDGLLKKGDIFEIKPGRLKVLE